MEPVAVYGFVVAWLGCLLVDLAQACNARPVPFPAIVKLVIVLVCLLMVLFWMYPVSVPRLR